MALRLSNVMKRGSGFPVAEIKNVLQRLNVHVLLYKLVCRVANCLISLTFFKIGSTIGSGRVGSGRVGSNSGFLRPDENLN